jgi:D-alanine transaminase
VREEAHGIDALLGADEVFVTSTIREVMGVTSLALLESGAPEWRRIADGKPGPLTRRLHAAFRRFVERTHLR